MISKKFLLVIHNSSIALQMVTYLESKNFQKQKIELTILIEKNYNYQKLKKDVEFIFQNFQYVLIYNQLYEFFYFHYLPKDHLQIQLQLYLYLYGDTLRL